MPPSSSPSRSQQRSISRRGRSTVVALLASGFALFVGQANSSGEAVSGNPEPESPGINAAEAAHWRLVWRDEFDGTALDETKWTAQATPRKDTQNTPDAVSVRDGIMTITTWTEEGKHRTGFLNSRGKFETTYGCFEARIRFHNSPGQWGAFWLSSPSLGNPLGDVAKAGAEIDIVEHRAVYGLGTGAGNDATNLQGMALHWDGYGEHHQSTGHPGHPAPGAPSLQDNWHTYAVLWTPEKYVFYLDGHEQWTTDKAVSQRPEFLLFTCEVADRGWAGAVPEGGFGSRQKSQTKMEVDWVRVWQKSSEPQGSPVSVSSQPQAPELYPGAE